MLKEIIDEVSKRSSNPEGKFAVFGDKRYKAVEFSEGNYQEITEASGPMVFIDGGNSEIVKAPGMTLQLLRNAAVVVKGNKMQESSTREFFVLVTAKSEGFRAKIFSDGESEVVETANGEMYKFVDSIRKASEVKFAIEMIGKGMIVLDGTLEAQGEIEQKHFDELRFEAVTKKTSVVALAKTTSLITEAGSSYAAMLGKKEGSWHYYPVAEINSESHKAEMFFVKLHERSNHVFRTEVFREQKEAIPKIAGALKSNANELTFPGYPYGLILADKLARVSNHEIGYMKAKLFAAAGSKWENLKKDLAALDAHEILDSM